MRTLPLALVLGLVATPALAQEASPLALAEAAYLEVDFEGIQTHARAALTSGALSAEELVRAYQLLGVAAAALGDLVTAHDHFLRMLQLDPGARLPDTVPPRLRGPYLEARGEISSGTESLGAEIGVARAEDSVRVTVTDPFAVVRRVRVHARLGGTTEYAVSEHDTAPEVLVSLVGAGAAPRVEVFVELLDEYGNRAHQVGDALEPFGIDAPVAPTAPPAPGGGTTVFEEPVFWIVVGSVVLVGAGITIGVVVSEQQRTSIVTTVSIGF